MRTKTFLTNFPAILRAFLLASLFSVSFVRLSPAADVSSKATAGARLKGAERPEKLISQIAQYSLMGDSTNLLNCFDTSTKVHEIGAKSFAISIELAKAKGELRDALVKKFGAEKVAALKSTYVLVAGFDPLKKVSDAFQNPTIAVTGDTAAVTFGSSSEIPLKLEKKNNRWLMVRELDGMAAVDV